MQPAEPKTPVVEAAAAETAEPKTTGFAGTARIEGRGGRPRSEGERSTSRPALALGGLLLVGIVAALGVVTFAPPSSSPAAATRATPDRPDGEPVEETTGVDRNPSSPRGEEIALRTPANTSPPPSPSDGVEESPGESPRDRPEEPATHGTLTVSASPWATVRVGRRSIGETPRRAVSVTTGAHQVSLDCPPLGTSVTVPVRVAEGVETRVIADMTQNPPAVTVR